MLGIELALPFVLPVAGLTPSAASAPSPLPPQVVIPAPPVARHRVHSPPVFTAGLLLGGRTLDSESYEPLEDHALFGFDLAATNLGAGPLGIEFGTQFSFDSQGTLDLAYSELFLGARLTFSDLYDANRTVIPYVSGGGTLIGADIRQNSISSRDDTTGYYLTAGLDFRVAPEVSIGLQYRHVGGTENDFGFAGLGGPDSDFDYDQVALRVGFYF